jgi:heme-degrading monooxygenase HmoA
LHNTQDIKYVKRNDVRLKPGKSEEFNNILLEFIKSVEGKVKGLKGFIVMSSTNNASEVIVLSLWETESDMEVFYHPSNKAFYEFVERASPLFENKPERTDYAVSHFRI